MKNKIVVRILVIFSFCLIGYFTALQIVSPSFISFSYVWLILGIGCLAVAFLLRRSEKNGNLRVLARRIPVWFYRVLTVLILSGFVTAGICLYHILTPRLADGTEPVRYLIVLGGGIQLDGELGPVPLRRIEKAADYLKTHPETVAIVSGGQGIFAPCAEAPVLARNLAALGVPSDRILEEDQALDTIQNFEYSARVAAGHSGVSVHAFLAEPVAVVTSDFHLARAEWLARREGYKDVYGIGSKTPALFMVTSYCREICSYVKLTLRILLTGKPEKLSK